MSKDQFPDAYCVPIVHRWNGGPMPVTADTLVLVQFCNGYLSMGVAALYTWGKESLIIGYTVLNVIKAY